MKPRPLFASWLAAWLGSLLAAAPVAAQQPADSNASEQEARLAKLLTWVRSKDERTRWRAVRAYVRMGEAAVPALMEVLEEFPSNETSARLAAEALGQLGPKATECLPQTLETLKGNGSRPQQHLALEVLARVGPHDPDQIQNYTQTVYNQLHRKLRSKTGLLVNCMVRLVEDPEISTEGLIDHLEGQSAAHREMALERLWWRGNDAKSAIPAIREVLTAAKQPRKTTFQFRGAGWGWSGSTSSKNSDAIRSKAALLLQKLGAKLPVAGYLQLVKHKDPAVRQRSVLKLGSLGDKVGPKGVEALKRAVFDRDKLVAWDAITALGMLGPGAKEAVPRLQSLAEGDDKAKAVRAAAALRRIQKKP